MSLPANIAHAIMETVLGRIALLFLSGASCDMPTARDAASQMLAAHNAATPDELTLAAEIVSLKFHALQALAEAAEPDLPRNNILRLRGSAVSLSRESHKSQRKLDQLQRARATAQPATAQHATTQHATTQPVQTPAPQPAANQAAEAALALVETAKQAIRIAQKSGGQRSGGQTWSQQLQKRMTANRMAEKVRKQQAAYNARQAAAAPPTPEPAAQSEITSSAATQSP